ncbi:hypothetical protein DSCO28_73780 (plasmid) [Desulfosarcina ovata subsp. sediminis]|uniref:MobA/VirD2-like nuclease domain-containing protein n=1 Tax=Desulfosarcina ovata subsp. sediminis TaxID=885957 RepID=A0A5K8A2S3_9BACT|nr:relaxase/mobilization nuclease domain-containing protein [Desulfosarcina ovata]BBO86812.1 hypothetical protein DSCO28_73780 [Desulfosarcina ovata subsp. sediminis]
MIPKATRSGSFKDSIAYIMHDKGNLNASERVEWYETGNMLTKDPETAAKIMAWTDINADHIQQQFNAENGIEKASNGGAKRKYGAVYHLSFSWAKDENPDVETQKIYALEALKNLQLENNQYVMACHNDTEHSHIHVIANLTNHETGKRAQIWKSQRRLQKQALEYEKEHGIYCEERFKTAAELEKARIAHKITRAYELSDNSQSFKAAVEEEGFTLAKGRRGAVVLVDDKGKIQKLARQLKGIEKPTEALKNKLKGIDLANLPDAEQKAEEIRAKQADAQAPKGQPETETAKKSQNSHNVPKRKDAQSPVYDREAEEVERQKKLADAAAAVAKEKADAQVAKEKEQKRIEKFFREQRKAKFLRIKKHMAKKAAIEKRYFEEIEARIEKKTAESRKTWQIEKLTEDKKKAAEAFNVAAEEAKKRKNLWDWLTGKWKKAATDAEEAAQKLEATEKTLAERMSRFEADQRALEEYRIQKAKEFAEKYPKKPKKQVSQRKTVSLEKSNSHIKQRKGAVGKEKLRVDVADTTAPETPVFSKPVERPAAITQESGKKKSRNKLSLTDKIRATRAAEKGELGQEYKKMAEDELTAEDRQTIQDQWQEHSGLDLEDSQEQKKEIDRGLEL